MIGVGGMPGFSKCACAPIRRIPPVAMPCRCFDIMIPYKIGQRLHLRSYAIIR